MGCKPSTPVHDKADPVKQQASSIKAVGQTERLVSRAARIGKKKKEDDNTPKLDTAGKLMPEEIARRTESSVTTSTVTLGTKESPVTVEYAYWTQRGYYPDTPHKDNQDSFNIGLKFGGSEMSAMMAVYDGHGGEGLKCSQFAKKQLPKVIAKYVRQARAKKYKEYLKENDIEGAGFDPQRWPLLTQEEYEECCHRAHLECNHAMHSDTTLEDKMSGTTAASVHFNGDFVTVCNIGDSRVLLGHATKPEYPDDDEKKEEEGNEEEEPEIILAIPLSRDQTAYRKDERERIKKEGGKIMSIDQIEGIEDMHEKWGDLEPGEFIDIHGDPPRVWQDGKDYPGTAFTRSLGDYIAESIGVNAEPEMLSTQLNSNDRILVIASDGIFEFLANQEVIDICCNAENPLNACKELVKAAYDQWLIHENRTDDITVIVCFLSCDRAPGPGTTEDLVRRAFETKLVRRLSRNPGTSLDGTAATSHDSDNSGEERLHNPRSRNLGDSVIDLSGEAERLEI